MRDFKVRLVARNEGIEYRDAHDVYRFNLRLESKVWWVLLPGSKGEHFEPHELTPDEEAVVLPRIKQYLEGRRYFVLFGPTFPVVIEREPPVAGEIAAARKRSQAYWAARKEAERQKLRTPPSDR
jgi:hypothetical protein